MKKVDSQTFFAILSKYIYMHKKNENGGRAKSALAENLRSKKSAKNRT